MRWLTGHHTPTTGRKRAGLASDALCECGCARGGRRCPRTALAPQALSQFGQLSGSLSALWGAAFTWTVKVDGGYARVIEQFPDPAAARLALHDLVGELPTPSSLRMHACMLQSPPARPAATAMTEPEFLPAAFPPPRVNSRRIRLE